MGLVCSETHFYDPDPVMGDGRPGRDLDKVWVGFQHHPPSRRVDIETVLIFHNVWVFWVYNVLSDFFRFHTMPSHGR